ncbi:DNA/RNA helicase domain-containing protein, partial [Brevundimonas diminuta]|uniref:DNA/RNA helicase domain-containing protein n=1 Tax=Brevundimonas diminuta TaxID=293 RepID=UPI003F80F277
HRLRKRVNLGSYYGIFDKVCTDLGLDKDSCSEVDWVTQQAKKAIFFYDPDQSIKPSDANAADFQKIKQSPDSRVMTLTSQFRVQAGQDYVDFIDRLLNIQFAAQEQYRSKKYDFLLFENIADLVQVIEQKNQTYGLARLVAGYAWPWHSKKDSKLHDIEIDNVKLRWNRTNTDWINTTGAEDEVGCIHTTQGYDLNYTGIIFGTEIGYDAATDQITINEKNYLDRNGKQTIK